MRASSTPRVIKDSSPKGTLWQVERELSVVILGQQVKIGLLQTNPQHPLHQAVSQLCPFSFKLHPYDLKLRSVLKQNSLRRNNTVIY